MRDTDTTLPNRPQWLVSGKDVSCTRRHFTLCGRLKHITHARGGSVSQAGGAWLWCSISMTHVSLDWSTTCPSDCECARWGAFASKRSCANLSAMCDALIVAIRSRSFIIETCYMFELIRWRSCVARSVVFCESRSLFLTCALPSFECNRVTLRRSIPSFTQRDSNISGEVIVN